MSIDLSTMSTTELRNLQASITEALKNNEKQELIKAREQIIAIAQSVGIPLANLVESIKKQNKEKKPVAVRYRHKEDPTKQWTGRGRKPNWVNEWVSAGNALEDLRV